MSRDGGFPIADLDVGLLDDPKVRTLVRSTRDEAIVARCMVAFIAVILASWRQGERVTLDEAAPLWLTGLDDLAERLRDAGLLDADGRVPEKSWIGWFGPASDRRATRRFEGAVNGLVSHGMTREAAIREAKRRQSEVTSELPLGDLDPSVPSVPSVPTVRPSSVREGKTTTTTMAGIVPSEGPCRDCGGYLTDKEDSRVGPGWIEHAEHPAVVAL